MIKALLLDLGGVLIHDPMHELWAEISRTSSWSYEEIEEWYREEIRYPLWSGALEEESFWREIALELDPTEDADHFREYLIESCRLLPAAARMKDLSSIAPLFALSNHRHEWADPVLEEHDLDKYFERLFISSQTGHVKPDEETFIHVLDELSLLAEDVLYVDDKEINLLAAKEVGIASILADPDGDWVDEIL